MRNEPKPLRYDAVPGIDIDAAFGRMRVLCAERDALERLVVLKELEIEKEWKAIPATVTIRRNLRCTWQKCPRLTMDRFNGRAQCAKHVAGGDPNVARVLEEFLRG